MLKKVCKQSMKKLEKKSSDISLEFLTLLCLMALREKESFFFVVFLFYIFLFCVRVRFWCIGALDFEWFSSYSFVSHLLLMNFS
jgi:hypothetical protein